MKIRRKNGNLIHIINVERCRSMEMGVTGEKSLRKYIIACTVLYLVISSYIIIHLSFSTTYMKPAENVRISSRAYGKDIQINQFGNWKTTYIKGVDIGAAKPGAFPGDFAVSKKEYQRWFKQIAKMNANTIRVYTILGPEFYEALRDYNETHFRKIYLIQGVWVDEGTILREEDAFSPAILDQFQSDITKAIDVIHGNIMIEPMKGEASGRYSKDVSKWVLGYILGIEWDGIFVKNTNDLHPETIDYDGAYLKTEHASPFEIFLSRAGDTAIAYETEKYGQQRMIAFSNWPTTDPLAHSSEEESVNFAGIDVENIKSTDRFYAGQFASYHVYPYYPDFFEFQEEYQIPTKDGTVNPYKVYLEVLNNYHSMPVVISEYGVPSSRGIARSQKANGYDQGNLTEKEQGEILVDLTKIIYDTGCAGGLIFSWQDEWFKRTWNTMDFSLPDYRAYWSDYQTNEQSFGLLAFDPGRKKSVCYVDGNPEEWNGKDVLFQNEGITVSMKQDEKFLYFRINDPGLDPDQADYLLPIDITEKSGILKSEQFHSEFERPSDFLIRIGGKDDSRILVHDYFDAFTFNFSRLLFRTDPYDKRLNKKEGDFVDIHMALRAPLLVESTGEYSEPLFFNTGRLTYGNANPKASDYNSLADYCAGENDIEIRIPWGLLNVMDPSSKQVMDDFYHRNRISPQSFDKIFVGLSKGESAESVRMYPFDYESWEEPMYHERLKESYTYVREVFRGLK